MSTETEARCGYAVVDNEGIEQPCDRPATGWRWYQDVEHEDTLDQACDWHENAGGALIAQALKTERTLARVITEWESDRISLRNLGFRALEYGHDFAADLRAALTPEAGDH